MPYEQLQHDSPLYAKSFLVTRGTPHEYHSVYLPGDGVEKINFPLFFLLTVKSAELKAPEILQQIRSAILAQAEVQAVQAELELINICRSLNQALPTVTGKSKAWCKKLGMLISVIEGSTLYLAAYGNVRAYLSRKNKCTDVVRTGAPDAPASSVATPQRSPFLFFPFFLEGRLEAGDKILLTSASLFDYFNLDKIAALMERGADESAHYLNRVLTALPGNVAVGGLTIEVLASERGERQEEEARESKTPPPEPKTLPHKASPLIIIPTLPRKQGLITLAAEAVRARLFRRVISIMQGVAEGVSLRVRAAVRAILPQRQNQFIKAPSTQGSGVWSFVKAHAARGVARFRKLPRNSQYFFLAAILIAALFLESIVAIARDQSRAREEQELAAAADAIALVEAEAEAALIYGDETKAREAFARAKSILEELAVKSGGAKEKEEELRQTLLNLKEKVYRIATITNPAILVDLAELNAGVKYPGGLVLSPPLLYSFATTEGTIYEINPDNKTVTLITGNTKGETAPAGFKLATKGDRGEIYLTSDKGIMKFEPATKMLTSVSTGETQSLAAIATYGSRLYTLNRQSGLIERFEIASTTLRAPTPWLKGGLTLPGATSMAIDGSIYIADASGVVRKFVQGIEEDFAVPELDPPLATPSRLIADGTYLYILEQTEKRIIVLSQTGKLVRQIISPHFDRLTDLAPHLSKKVLYVLSGAKIYTIPFTP